jgi:hypothetical protein
MRRYLIRAAHSVPEPIARVAYDGIVATELSWERLRSSGASDGGGLEDVTAVVKTFERPRTLRRLVESVCLTHPSLRMIVVDDSETPVCLSGVENIVMPFNSGLSAGRQEALARVTTPFFLLLDDDHVFYRGTTLERAVAVMQRHPEIDIMGGDEILLPLYAPSQFWRGDVYDTRPPTLPRGSALAGLPVCDRVPNFFLARTERLRLIGWSPELKLLEHNDFFARARGVLTTVFNRDFRVLHARTPLDREYMSKRMDVEGALRVLAERYGTALYSVEGVDDTRYPLATLLATK